MVPVSIICEDCGETAKVRGYGRVEYDWDNTESGTMQLTVKLIRLTVDCPCCGVKVQDHRPTTDAAGTDTQGAHTPPRRPR
jgi:hypothetical protein